MFSPDLVDRICALKHDLGKYVAWRSANLTEEEWRDAGPEAQAAVRNDILRTKTLGDGTELSAWMVLRMSLDAFSDHERTVASPELNLVCRNVEVLESLEGDIVSGDAVVHQEIQTRLRQAQAEIRNSLSALVRRARQEARWPES